MAMLLFYVGETRFAIACASILRIVPHVILEKMPSSSSYVAGLLFLGKEPIPVIDFCQMIENRAARPFLNSKIVILQDKSSNRCVGLLGEKMEGILDLSLDQFNKSEFYFPHCHYLAKGYPDERGIIHAINVDEFFRYLFSDVFDDPGNDRYGS